MGIADGARPLGWVPDGGRVLVSRLTCLRFACCLACAVAFGPTLLRGADEGSDIPRGPIIQDAVLPVGGPGFEGGTNLTVRQLLDSVLGRFPLEPLLIEGDLIVRRPRGSVLEEHGFQMYLQWGENPARAQYMLLDPEKRPLESMLIVRPLGQAPRMSFMLRGKEAPLPDLYAPIHQTDVSWMDLTLSFLWWPGGRIVGKEVLRGYTCHVVEIPRPAEVGSAGPAGKDVAYSSMKLWIEEKMHVLLQAEGLNENGKAVRRLWVTSCKKINDRWMIKDMEIEGFPTAHRTKLIVRDVTSPSDATAEAKPE